MVLAYFLNLVTVVTGPYFNISDSPQPSTLSYIWNLYSNENLQFYEIAVACLLLCSAWRACHPGCNVGESRIEVCVSRSNPSFVSVSSSVAAFGIGSYCVQDCGTVPRLNRGFTTSSQNYGSYHSHKSKHAGRKDNVLAHIPKHAPVWDRFTVDSSTLGLPYVGLDEAAPMSTLLTEPQIEFYAHLFRRHGQDNPDAEVGVMEELQEWKGLCAKFQVLPKAEAKNSYPLVLSETVEITKPNKNGRHYPDEHIIITGVVVQEFSLNIRLNQRSPSTVARITVYPVNSSTRSRKVTCQQLIPGFPGQAGTVYQHYATNQLPAPFSLALIGNNGSPSGVDLISQEMALYYVNLFRPLAGKTLLAKETSGRTLFHLPLAIAEASVPTDSSVKTSAIAQTISVNGYGTPLARLTVLPVCQETGHQTITCEVLHTDFGSLGGTAVRHFAPTFARQAELAPTTAPKPLGAFILLSCPELPGSALNKVYAWAFFAGNPRSLCTGVYSPVNGRDPTVTMIENMFHLGYAGSTFYAPDFAVYSGFFVLQAAAELKQKGYKVRVTFKHDVNEFTSISVVSDGPGGPITFRGTDTILSKEDGLEEQLAMLDPSRVMPAVGRFPEAFVSHRNMVQYQGPQPGPEYYRVYPGLIDLKSSGGVWKLSHQASSYARKLVLAYHAVVRLLDTTFQAAVGSSITRKSTPASFSFDYYLRQHFNDALYPWRMSQGTPSAQVIRRYAYKGGLAQAPLVGRVFSSVYMYDVISIYPSIIRDCPMPGGTMFWLDSMTLEHFGFVKVLARAPKNKLPCFLPVRVDEFGTNECLGHDQLFTGLFFTEEVVAAKAYGYEVEVKGGYCFDKIEGGFTSFVDSCFAKRQEAKAAGDRVLERVFKMLLNSLYGRFGINTIGWPRSYLVTAEEAEKLKYDPTTIKPLPNGMCLVGDYGVSPGSNQSNMSNEATSVEVAAAITAYGRIKIAQFKNIPGNPLLYSHTDSIFLEHPLPPAIQDAHVSGCGTELGKLKYLGRGANFIALNAMGYAFTDSEGAPQVVGAGLLSYKEAIDAHEAAYAGKPFTFDTTVKGGRDFANAGFNSSAKKLRTMRPRFVSTTPVKMTNHIVNGLGPGNNNPFEAYVGNQALIPDRLQAKLKKEGKGAS